MHSGGNPEYGTAIVHKIRLLQMKIVIILKHCYLMYFQYDKMMSIFKKYTWQTRTSGNISPMNKKIIDVFSPLKHVEANIVVFSSSSGFLNAGQKFSPTVM